MKRANLLCIVGLSLFMVADIQSFWYDPYAGDALLNERELILWGKITTCIGATVLGFFYMASQIIVQDQNELLETEYPCAHAWYNKLAYKYPQFNLHDKKFLCNTNKEQAKISSWNARHNIIECCQDTLKSINDYYKAKRNGIALDYQISFLAEQEFELLVQAGYIENYGTVKTFAYLLSLLVGVEALKIGYREWTDASYLAKLQERKLYIVDSPYIDTHRSAMSNIFEQRNAYITVTEGILFVSMATYCMKYQEIQSYKFAIQYAETDILEAVIKRGSKYTQLIKKEIEFRLNKMKDDK